MGYRTKAFYCIQCTDRVTGKVGDFVYYAGNQFEAVSPVFANLEQLYAWMKQNNWQRAAGGRWNELERTEQHG